MWQRGTVKALWRSCPFIVSVILCGCGDDSFSSNQPPPPPPSKLDACGKNEPCGGDIQGTWTVVSQCTELEDVELTDLALPAECRAGNARRIESETFSDVNVQIVFDVASYQASGGLVRSTVWSVEDACVQAQTGSAPSVDSCQAFGTSFQVRLDPSYSAACIFANGACTCTFKEGRPVSTGGTYATAGMVIQFDGAPYAGDYCARSTSATLDFIAPYPGTGQITTRMQLQRQ